MTAHTTDGGPAFPVHDLQAAQPSSMNDLNAMARGMSLREADAEIERLRARVASLEESLHYANGVADLAMKHRDDAENRVAELEQDAERYRWLRQRDLETIGVGGVFAGMTPENIVLNGDDLDNAIDAALAKDGA
jgi:hypothetical protein